MIAEQAGADTFEISTVAPYPDDYDECTEVAKQEQEENARPELTASVENMADYDVIFLGYPIWWSDMPMAVYSFLESYDFSGKTIIPFCTHEGSGISSTESSIAEVCPDTEVLEGLGIRGSIAQNSQDEAKETVDGWPGHVIKDIKSACKGAEFIHEMEIQFDSTGGAELVTKEAEIEAWIEKIK